jgi:RyR domain-containing protein
LAATEPRSLEHGDFMAEATYVPHPLDTSHISLAHLEPLLEQLARNAHEMWAQKRIEDGWKYGPERNDRLKTHPSLVPYEELDESEKSYDRALVNEALKSILSLGYTIEKKS